MSIRMSPNQREVLSAISSITGRQEYLKSTNGVLDVGATFSGTSFSISDGVTSSVKASVVQSSADPTKFGLVSLNPDGSNISGGGGGGGTQYTNGGTPPANPIGTAAVYDNAGTWASVSTTNRWPVSATQSGTWNIGTVTAVTAITNALPAGSNVIGHVITDTGSTTAVTGTVTVSGTVTANAGTNLNTSLLALESGGNLVSIKTNTDNLNLAIASTTSGQKGNLVLGATTTAAPTYTTAQSNPLSLTTGGLLRVDGSGVTQPVSLSSTTITGTVAVTQSTSPWIVAGGGTAGTAASGVVTVQGIASMTPVQVSQATASNLNATVVGTGTFVVQATLAAETTKVIGTVNQGTSPWVTSNATTSVVGNGAAATAQRVTLANDSTGILATVGTVTTVTTLTGTTTLTPGTSATNLGKAEDAAHTTGDTGVFALGVRNDTLAATTNTSADYTQLTTDQAGIVITAGAPRALKGRQVTTITSSTAETTIVTSVASTFLDMYGLILTNTSASATKVSIRDATAGGTISVFEVPATDTRGFMLPLDSAIPQAAVSNNWTAQCGTSVASLEVTVLFVKRV